MKIWCILTAIACCTSSTVSGWSNNPQGRRIALYQGAAVAGASLFPFQSTADDDETNAFIQRLKMQSEQNRDIYKKEAQSADSLSARQFASQYRRPTYIGVYRSDASVDMLLPGEIDELLQQNKIQVVYGVKVNAKTGEEKPDFSQKKYIYVD